MSYVKGVFKKSIYKREDTGYIIGLFKVKDTDIDEFKNKTITFTGYFHSLIEEDNYKFDGEVVNHDRYGKQLQVSSYEKVMPETKDGLVDFLSSSLFKGIGEGTAKKIVDILGKDTLTVILENPENLLLIPGITKKQINTLHDTLVNYQESYQVIVKLNKLGFTTKESMLIYKKYKGNTENVIDENIYLTYLDIDKLSFKHVDYIALSSGVMRDSLIRIEAGIIYVLIEISNSLGHSYLSIEEIYGYTVRALQENIDKDSFVTALNNLITDMRVINVCDKYYLKEMYEAENNIVKRLCYLTRKKDDENKKLDKFIMELERDTNIIYNFEQISAIKDSFIKNFLVITGGPGTGKTTLIKGIVNLYREMNKLSNNELSKELALLAPTGRASKRLAESTNVPASTIHRFLKWNKDDNSFQVNEYNKSDVKLVIIDEASMIDVYLFSSLLNGLRYDTKIIMVGDYNQLPSVGPGQVLKDIIDSDVVNVIKLDKLYRQSEGSNIIKLAYDINSNNIDTSVFNNIDTYFIPCPSGIVKNNIVEICKKYIDYDYSKFQVLAPMYKTINGIDEINLILQELYNPVSPKKNEIIINDIVYRENDKVIQLTNMVDDNVFNGDVGIIDKIRNGRDKEVIIDFDGNLVTYKPSDFQNFKHAYSISIHKSQGSEFDIVVIPIVKGYGKMLYRKLIYTAVTRAKKELYLIGDIDALFFAASNNQADIRKTTIKDILIEKI